MLFFSDTNSSSRNTRIGVATIFFFVIDVLILSLSNKLWGLAYKNMYREGIESNR